MVYLKAAVSIVTPTYNRAHLLERLWKSIKAQSFQEFEWIIVDDGSNDNTSDVVEKFADPRIKYIYQENMGVNYARNRGELEIKCEYVIFIDSDDVFFDNSTVNRMLTEIKGTSEEIGVVSFTTICSDSKKSLSNVIEDKIIAGYPDHIEEKKFTGEFLPIYKTDILNDISWPLFNGFEMIRHWKIARKTKTIILNKPGRIYYQDDTNSLSNSRSLVNRANNLVLASEHLLNEFENDWEQHCPEQIGKYSFYHLCYMWLSMKSINLFPVLSKIIKYGNNRERIKAIIIITLSILPLKYRQEIFILLKS